jgi:PIN domain nuclease of toxin-antitoxin system
MPNRYVLDAHAWVEYLRGSAPGRRVRDIVETGDIYTSSLTLADVISHVSRQKGDASVAVRAIQTISDVVEVDNDIAIKAAQRYSRMKKGSLEHAYLLETAKKVGAEIVSGDRSFVSGRKISIK